MNWNFKALSTWVALFAGIYLAVLPMANTIALRNVSLLALLVCLAWAWRDIQVYRKMGAVVLLWAGYLLIFPVFATDHATAWSSFTGQWGRGLLAMAVGAGTAAVLSGRVGMFAVGLVSATPLFVHLVLVANKVADSGTIPWNYWGREVHHADLGFAAGHVVVLMSVVAIVGNTKQRLAALAVIAFTLLSLVIAQSRAGLAFALLGAGMVLWGLFASQASTLKRHAKPLAVCALAFAVLIGYGIKEDPRWHRMADQLAAGWVGDAIQTECEGVPTITANIAQAYGQVPHAQQLIESVRYGDGSRTVLLRAGMELALKNPWGSDGSRQAFQKLLAKECPNPAIVMAHAHNGWIDTMLAIGIVGAALYMGVLLSFARKGYASFRSEGAGNPWALALLVLAVFWIVRGFTDSVYRDHMLEMQGFLLAFAWIASNEKSKPRL